MMERKDSRMARPLPVTLVACLFLATGIIGFVYHLSEIRGNAGMDSFWILLTEALAIVSGVYLLRGRNWARWLALLWLAFHVGLSYFHSLQEMAIHALLLSLIAFLLFRPRAAEYFA